jgi:periplasmic divalent cation tolerance protein
MSPIGDGVQCARRRFSIGAFCEQLKDREAEVDSGRGYSIVLTTCGTREDARPVIDALIAARLTPCVQAMPINSTYVWEGELHNEDEVLLLIKSKTADFERIERMILELHPYELPEIVQVPLTDGFDRYFAWIDDPYA